MDALRPEFADRVAFVTADLSTREGQSFASRFGVAETTLVFFDRTGMPINQYHGAITEAYLRRLMDQTYGAGTTSPEFDRQLEAIRRKYNETAKSIIDSMGR